eukprot:scaffold681_cov173-Ochromonas_danica.AAC.32
MMMPSIKASPSRSIARLYSVKSFASNPPSMHFRDTDVKKAGELLDFLTMNINKLNEDEATFMSEFENLTALSVMSIRDPELLRLLKECGWTGCRYILPTGKRWDVDYIIQALSNYYLKSTNGNNVASSIRIFSTQTTMGRHHSAFDNISPFCPTIVVDAIKKLGGQWKEPFVYNVRGACMLADISGFSAYSGLMCSRGVTGLDELRSVTNGLLGHFVQTVYNFGGDVIAFAGDALICVFAEEDEEDSTEQSEKSEKINCCVRALVCASLLCQDQSHHLSTHVGISYGNMSLGPKEVAANSACIEKIQDDPIAQRMLRFIPYDTEKTTYQIILQSNDTDFLQRDYNRDLYVKRDSFREQLFFPDEEELFLSPGKTHRKEKKEEHLITSQLIKLVPKPVKQALRGDILDNIGELRQVTTLFMSLDSYDKNEEGRDPLKLQPLLARAQECLRESGAFLRQFLVDDKGCVLIAMWGVPSYSYANNCSRAIYFAVSLQHAVLSLNHRCSIGISTGMVFCGCVGADARKDYVGIGTDVNIAARLMSKANGRILADSTTYQNSNPPTRELLIPAEELKLKGMSEPMRPYTYGSSELPPLTEPDRLDSNYLLQKRITNMIDFHLDEIANSELGLNGDFPKASIFILGPAGSGKSMASAYCRLGAQKRGMQTILLQVQSFHKGVPYSVIRLLLSQLIGSGEEEQDLEMVHSFLRHVISSCFPLYNDVEIDVALITLERILGRNWESQNNNQLLMKTTRTTDEYDNALAAVGLDVNRNHVSSRSMSDADEGKGSPAKSSPGANRAEIRKQGEMILLRVLHLLLSKNGPMTIILENGHLCDELSWKCINALFNERNLQLLLAVTVLLKVSVSKRDSGILYKKDKRRGSNSSTKDVDEILGSVRQFSGLSLGKSTSENDAMQDDLSPTNGQPTPNSHRSRITRRLESELPNGCLGLMSRRFSDILELGGLNKDEIRDLLRVTLSLDEVSDSMIQMVMDVSSGNPFWCNAIASFIKDRGYSELEEAHKKSEADSHSLQRMLVICRLDPLPMFQATLYDLSLPTDSALVHQTIAECIEVSQSDNLRPFYPMLAYHYKKSGVEYREQAFKYELKSADQAIAEGAFVEGLEFAKSALSIAEIQAELYILLDVLNAGLEDMAYNLNNRSFNQPSPVKDKVSPSIFSRNSRNGGTIFNFGTSDKLMKDYNALKQDVENLAQGRKSPKTGHHVTIQEENLDADSEKRERLRNRSATTTLNWQVSYAHRKREKKRAISAQSWFYFRSPRRRQNRHRGLDNNSRKNAAESSSSSSDVSSPNLQDSPDASMPVDSLKSNHSKKSTKWSDRGEENGKEGESSENGGLSISPSGNSDESTFSDFGSAACCVIS